MRELASAWVNRGGTFAVASSLAPFKTVASDPSGCRSGNAQDASGQTCPLFAFAFIAPGDEMRVLATLAGVFENLYAWPMVSIPPSSLAVLATASSDITVEPLWSVARDSTPIVRTRGAKSTNSEATATMRIADSTSVPGATLRKLLDGQGVQPGLFAKSLDVAAAQREWAKVAGGASVIRPTGPGTVAIVSRGPTSAKSIVRLELVPTGEPSWLAKFDAADASDVLRTYGLGRLFESFRQDATNGVKPIAHVYFVVN
jgi:hypothetical protein